MAQVVCSGGDTRLIEPEAVATGYATQARPVAVPGNQLLNWESKLILTSGRYGSRFCFSVCSEVEASVVFRGSLKLFTTCHQTNNSASPALV
jgi:hypothetical protein